MTVRRRTIKNETVEQTEGNTVVIRSRNQQKEIDNKKRKAGLLGYRNRKYDPEMCSKVVDMMAEGRSKYEIAVELGVVTDTLERWAEEKEEFAEAMHLGMEACRAWWERKARENIVITERDIKFNTNLWTFNMKNRFGWAEKTEVEDKRHKVRELEEKKAEIEQSSGVEHTAAVLQILRGSGILQESSELQSTIDQSIKTKAD